MGASLHIDTARVGFMAHNRVFQHVELVPCERLEHTGQAFFVKSARRLFVPQRYYIRLKSRESIRDIIEIIETLDLQDGPAVAMFRVGLPRWENRIMQKIEELFAFIVADRHQGVEGILTRDTIAGRIPMVAQSREQLELFHLEAMDSAAGLGMPLSVAHFKRVGDHR